VAGRNYAAAAARLQEILGPDSALIGGLAVNAYGFVRATQDVDIVVRMPLAEAKRALEAHGIKVEMRKGDPFEGGFSSLSGVIGAKGASGRVHGVLFDVLPELVPVAPERLVHVTLQGHSLRIVDLETLIRLKLKAGGPSDLYDVGVLVHLNPAARQAALDHATHKPRLLERVKRLLDDQQIARKADELRRGEKLLATFARRRPRARKPGPRGER
jgi:hypothetical protein